MYAAVVRSFSQPPQYETFDTPVTSGDDEMLIDVLAVGLHPRVRSGASGTHYSGAGQLPMIPGIDGVGRLPDGGLVYFVTTDTIHGSMAEQTVIDRRESVRLPAEVNPLTIAAAMNPAMSSWLALRKRISFAPRKRVLILGATGSAGQMAIQIARHLGASQVIAAGRDARLFDLLTGLGANTVVSMAGEPEAAAAAVGEAAAEVDVVIDYVWGRPAEKIMPALLTRRAAHSRLLDWVHIGATAGPTVALSSEVLRRANLHLVGSGQGSLSRDDILTELPALVDALVAGKWDINVRAIPLADVESAWGAEIPPGQRVVFTPHTSGK